MTDEETVVQRASLLIEADRPEQAMSVLAPWLAGHPGSAPALVQACLAHRLLHEPDKALSAVRTAAPHAPHDPYVLLVLAGTLLAAGQRLPADQLARQLVLAHPQDTSVHQMAARTAIGLGIPGEIRALRHARRAVELAPTDRSRTWCWAGCWVCRAGSSVAAGPPHRPTGWSPSTTPCCRPCR